MLHDTELCRNHIVRPAVYIRLIRIVLQTRYVFMNPHPAIGLILSLCLLLTPVAGNPALSVAFLAHSSAHTLSIATPNCHETALSAPDHPHRNDVDAGGVLGDCTTVLHACCSGVGAVLPINRIDHDSAASEEFMIFLSPFRLQLRLATIFKPPRTSS